MQTENRSYATNKIWIMRYIRHILRNFIKYFTILKLYSTAEYIRLFYSPVYNSMNCDVTKEWIEKKKKHRRKHPTKSFSGKRDRIDWIRTVLNECACECVHMDMSPESDDDFRNAFVVQLSWCVCETDLFRSSHKYYYRCLRLYR